MAAHVSGHSTDSRIKLRGKRIVYTSGFQKLKKRAFSLSLKASQKEYMTSNEMLAGSTASAEQHELAARSVLPNRLR